MSNSAFAKIGTIGGLVGLAVAWWRFPWLPDVLAYAGLAVLLMGFISLLAIVGTPAANLANHMADSTVARSEARARVHALQVQAITPEENNNSTTTTTKIPPEYIFAYRCMVNLAGEGGRFPAYDPDSPQLASYVSLLKQEDGRPAVVAGKAHAMLRYNLGLFYRAYQASPAAAVGRESLALAAMDAGVVAEAELPVKRGPGRPRKVRE